MKLDVFDGQSKVNSVEVSSLIGKKSESSVYQAVVARLSHEREGNVFTKTKSEVQGGGKKPWKQKGLGRARAGSIRSPLWKGGGVTFGPKPRDFSKTLNDKQRYRAYVSLFTAINEAGNLTVIKDFAFDKLKTKDFLKFLSGYVSDMSKRVVLINGEYNKPLYLSSRNIANVKVEYVDNMDILSLAYADKVLITEKAVSTIDRRFSGILKSGDKK